MLVFGGFNGSYFQDLFHISVHEAKTKYEIQAISDDKILTKFLNNKQYSDYSVKTLVDEDFYINIGLISNHF